MLTCGITAEWKEQEIRSQTNQDSNPKFTIFQLGCLGQVAESHQASVSSFVICALLQCFLKVPHGDYQKNQVRCFTKKANHLHPVVFAVSKSQNHVKLTLPKLPFQFQILLKICQSLISGGFLGLEGKFSGTDESNYHRKLQPEVF